MSWPLGPSARSVSPPLVNPPRSRPEGAAGGCGTPGPGWRGDVALVLVIARREQAAWRDERRAGLSPPKTADAGRAGDEPERLPIRHYPVEGAYQRAARAPGHKASRDEQWIWHIVRAERGLLYAAIPFLWRAAVPRIERETGGIW